MITWKRTGCVERREPGEYHYVHTNGSSMVVPVMEDGKMLLVNQYRYLRDRESLDQVGEFNPFNGVTDEMCRVYVAKDLQFVGGTPDETEEFEIVRASSAEIEANIRAGVIWDGMTIAAWAIAKSGRV